MSLLKLDPAFRVLLPEGANGGTGEIEYDRPYRLPAMIAGASSAFKISILDPNNPRLGKIVSLAGGDVSLLGAKNGEAEPPYVTVRIYPEFPVAAGQPVAQGEPIEFRGRPHEFPAGSGLWDLADLGSDNRPVLTTPEQKASLVEALAASETIIERYDASTVELAAERGRINALKLDLQISAAGLQGLKVRTLQNATPAATAVRRLVWGLRSRNFKLPLWVDDLGHTHITVARIKDLILSGALSIPSLLTGRVQATELEASRLELPSLTVKPAPASSGIVQGWTSKNGKKIAWIDPSGVFHIRKLGPGVTGYAVWGGTLASQLAPALPLAGVVNLGIAGQTSADVAARWGALDRAATFKATGLSSGVYTLTLLDSDRSPLYSAMPQTQTGRLGGVRGTLRRGSSGQTGLNVNRAAYYGFVPDAGAALELNLAHAWVPDNPHRPRNTILAVGRSDLTGTGDRRVLDGRMVAQNVRTILVSLSGRHERFLVLGLYNTSTETYGAGLEEITQVNAGIASVAGPGYVDARAALCRNADGSWRTDGTPDPAYLEADGLTLNAAGLARLAAHVAAAAQERGMS
ncbi:hypothetical protein [Deinococcus budaensis]|uniref:Lysophospholipase L1-like esterase n=1 Tax=Deinococcus budaensis TaxID=1665626 RepID=A0A7W8LQ55_9DEIO|nr:hypothetical protein [Deinococcus budaensis]MBB5234483.1 lysophospholipase L1-like esterase [Deinococcus budaensis]